MFIFVGLIFSLAFYALSQFLYSMGYFHNIWEGASVEVLLVVYLLCLWMFFFSLKIICQRLNSNLGYALVFSTLTLYTFFGLWVLFQNKEAIELGVSFVAFVISCLVTAVFFAFHLLGSLRQSTNKKP